ncbi:VanW family protein [Gordonia neofelifaecis]|uniref:VanW family protein n=1 Tax=Gordonia neofelifaecis NRRL B-59395 TaxID=644548 RepID=F1YPU5_9ACTN|nr:VanW family protein [Gordonia neofelifaecis]EGD53275.1 VanW family protein [Gordonia neofelifaecis NRRL B-59395]
MTSSDDRSDIRRWIVRGLLGGLLLIGAAFGIDAILTHGHTARGAHIAEFDLGGLTEAQARAELEALTVASHSPVSVRTNTGSAHIDPETLGATFDVDATLDRLMDQPKNPWDRFLGMVGVSRDVAPVVTLDDAAFNAALDKNREVLEKAAVEGGVHFDGLEPVGDFPSKGLRIKRDAAKQAIADNWLSGHPVDLEMEPFSPTVSAETVQATLDGPAQEVTASAIPLSGRGSRVIVSPREAGRLVTFVPDGKGGLAAHVDPKKAQEILGDRAAKTESKPVDATFRLTGGTPTVVPSTEGATVDWVRTADALAALSTQSDKRSGDVVYKITKPKVDTKRASKLGVKEVVSEFTTGGFSGPSGENIRLVAEQVNGAVVLPGQTFSLNGYTGPRGSAQGYVKSGIIDHGRPSEAVGGGISQFATTLYNASYFAGLEDVTHTEHSYYISRYPEAREATVFEGAIDLQFKNNTPYGIVIETGWTPSNVTVRMWSTKTMEVESVTGDRTAPTSPSTVVLPAGDECVASSGQPGFTASNTRIIRSLKTGQETYRHTRTVKYDPEPVVRCR